MKEKLVRVDMHVRADAMRLIKARARRDRITKSQVMEWLMGLAAASPPDQVVAEIRANGLWNDPDDPNYIGIVVTHLALKHLRVN